MRLRQKFPISYSCGETLLEGLGFPFCCCDSGNALMKKQRELQLLFHSSGSGVAALILGHQLCLRCQVKGIFSWIHLYCKTTDASPRIKPALLVSYFILMKYYKLLFIIHYYLKFIIIYIKIKYFIFPRKYKPRAESPWCRSEMSMWMFPAAKASGDLCSSFDQQLPNSIPCTDTALNQFLNPSPFLAVTKNMCPLIKLTRNC